MNFTKKNILISFIIFLAVLLFQWFNYQTVQWIPLANSLFLVALPLVIIGLFGFVLSNGAFDFFHYSMKKVAKLRKRKQDTDEIEEDNDPQVLSKSIGQGYRSVLTVGMILLVLSILFLWDYFL